MVHDVELLNWSFTSSAGKIITSKNKIMKYLFAIFVFASFSMFTQASAFEIGVVDLNQALNQSEPGIRSKNILERRGRQKQQGI